MSSSRRLSPLARPLMKQVLPAPRSPVRPSSSPPSSSDASRRPHDLVSCGERLSISKVAPVSVAALAIAIINILQLLSQCFHCRRQLVDEVAGNIPDAPNSPRDAISRISVKKNAERESVE